MRDMQRYSGNCTRSKQSALLDAVPTGKARPHCIASVEILARRFVYSLLQHQDRMVESPSSFLFRLSTLNRQVFTTESQDARGCSVASGAV